MTSHPYVGTWKLVAMEVHTGVNIVYPLGPNCQGLMILDEFGTLAAQLMNPDRPQFAGGDMLAGTTPEIEAAYKGYVAFWGDYEIDEKASLLRYHVRGSLFPNWIGNPQERIIQWDGQRLTCKTTPLHVKGQQVVGLLVWEKQS